VAFTIAIVVTFLSGAVVGVLLLLVVGIHRGDRTRRLADAPRTHIEAVTRRVLGVGTRSYRGRTEDEEG
jgi:hypothetical protein